MVYIGSVGQGIPKYEIDQATVKQLVQNVFTNNKRKLDRLMPSFDNAKVNERQLVVDKDWFREAHSFQDKNNLYVKNAIDLSLSAIDNCLKDSDFVQKPIPYEAIDLIAFVSSTGIATPSIDAHLINERPFREDIVRIPMWGLGCGGGASGLSRAYEWLKYQTDKVALVVCCELCSLTFQKDDTSMSNTIGTAIFGDGVGACLLVGEDSTYASHLNDNRLVIKATSSLTKKDTIDIMGWEVTDNGLEVIFSKKIPKLIKLIWQDHVATFLKENYIKLSDISQFVSHPGGRKVLEEMEAALHIKSDLLIYSYKVLAEHGNVSSATVIYVLKHWLKHGLVNKFDHQKGIVSALGPGFSSELLLVEWISV